VVAGAVIIDLVQTAKLNRKFKLIQEKMEGNKNVKT